MSEIFRLNISVKGVVENLLQKQEEFSHSLQLNPVRRNDPLNTQQSKQVSHLQNVWMVLQAISLPIPRRPSTMEVHPPIHNALSSLPPVPPSPSATDFYRGSKLPLPFFAAQSDYSTLLFRSMLLWNEGLHQGEVLLKNMFPNKTHSDIQAMEDWETIVSTFTTAEVLGKVNVDGSPSMVALALLADPFSLVRGNAISPACRRSEQSCGL